MSILRNDQQIHEQRWLAACDVVSKYKKLFDTGDYIIMDSDGEIYSPTNTKLVIDLATKNIYFSLITSDKSHMIQQIYEADPEYDHGLQFTAEEFEMEFKQQYQVYSRKPIEV